MGKFLKKNITTIIVALISLLMPFIISSLIYTFKTLVEHEVRIKVIENEINGMDNRVVRNRRDQQDTNKEIIKLLREVRK